MCAPNTTTTTTFLCYGPRVWGTGETAAEARRNALKHRASTDPRGPNGKPVWRTYELDERVEWRIALGVSFSWPEDAPPPRLVEVRDGRGRLLPLSSVEPMKVV